VADRTEDKSAIESGLNSVVRYQGRRYQVQTQCSERAAPVIESLIFHGGQTLVRITASYDDVASRLGFTGADGRYLVELQHTDLIRKIRYGMLRGDEADAPPPYDEEGVRLVDGDGVVVDPAQIDDPSVRELLRELGVVIDEVCSEEAQTNHRAPEPSPSAPPRPWWRRLVLRIRLPFGG
jgi:hypothetical protein